MTGRLSPFLLVLAALALLDFLAVPLLNWAIDAGPGGDWGMASGMGAFLAQFGILPAWLVWGWRPFWLRTLIHWCSATGLLLALVLGSVCTELGSMVGPSPTIVRDVFLVALMIPAISLAVEGPLWLTRIGFGWRLVPPSVAPEPERKLAIRDFLVGMSVVAVALTAARLSMTLAGSATDINFWIRLAITAACAVLASAVALPLTAWAILRLDDWRRGLVIVAIYGLAVGSLLPLVLHFIIRPATFFTPFLLMLLLQAAFAGVSVASVLLARWAGYRLQIG